LDITHKWQIAKFNGINMDEVANQEKKGRIKENNKKWLM